MTSGDQLVTAESPRLFWMPTQHDRDSAREIIEAGLADDVDPDLFELALEGVSQTSSDDLFRDGAPATEHPRIEAVADLYTALSSGEIEVTQ